MEKNEELESVEFVRGKLVKNDPPLSSPESIPTLINYIDIKIKHIIDFQQYNLCLAYQILSSLMSHLND